MDRRTFIKDNTKLAVSISCFGSIKWSSGQFVGDTPTTTDILGPYYRPGAPLRRNINPSGFSGELLHLSGTIFKEDGRSPIENALIEIWQCDSNQHYDNSSDEYRYRGVQKTDLAGKYSFITTQPVPYPAEEGSPIYRPAHIHLHVSGDGQQDLITQIYFKGDSYIQEDPSASAPTAIKRILSVISDGKHEKQLVFDIIMAKEFKPEDIIFENIAGLYKMNDKSMMEFYRDGDLLFIKWNGQIREALSYKGNNKFSGGINNATIAEFELLANQSIKVKVHYDAPVRRKEFNIEGMKVFKY